jgi:replicative DNA helicase
MSKIKYSSPRAELAVLRGLCAKDKKIAGTLLSLVDESYFYEVESQEVFGAIKKHLRDEGETPTYRLLIDDPGLSEEARDHLRASQAVVTNIQEARRAAKTLNTFRQRRGLYNLAANINTAFQSSKLDLDALLEQTATGLNIVRSRKSTTDSFLHMGKGNNTLERIKHLLYDDRSEDLIPTGIKAFDDVAGGWARGSLVTIGSTSGGGKSTTSMAIGMKMARAGYKVLMVPLEMTKDEMLMRAMANTSKMNLTKIIRGTLSDAERELVFKRHRRWEKKVHEAGGRFTIFEPEEDMTIEEIMAASSAYQCDVKIIDYASLLKGADGEDQWRALGQIARYCKVNAKTDKCVNVLIVQIGEDGKIRYSRAMSEHSNNSWVWIARPEDKETGIMTVEQPKSRNSMSYPFKIKIVYEFMRVEDVDDSEFGPGPGVEDPGTTTTSTSRTGKRVKVTSKRASKDVPNLAADI